MGNSVGGSSLHEIAFERKGEVSTPREDGGDERTQLIARETSEQASFVSLWRSTTTKHKMLLLYLACGRFSTSFCACIPTPFLARVVHDRGGTIVQTTAILQIMYVTMAIICALLWKYQKRFGCKLLYFGGIILYGMCQAAFGFIEFIKDFDTLISCTLLLKALQGVGLGAYVVALIVIICQEFSQGLWHVFAIVELAFGIGYFAGPLIGGVFFTLSGGLLLPCVTSGLIILLSCSSGVILLKGFVQDNSERPNCDIHGCIFDATSFIFLGCAVTAFGCFGIFDAAFTEYLGGLKYTVMDVGIIMFTGTILYCPSVLIAWYISRIPICLRRTLLILSLCGMAAISLLFSSAAARGELYAGALILRLLGGVVLVVAFNEFISEMISRNPQIAENYILFVMKLKVWTIVMGIGSFVLPIVGSVIAQNITFRLTMLVTVSGGFLITLVIACLIHLIMSCSATS